MIIFDRKSHMQVWILAGNPDILYDYIRENWIEKFTDVEFNRMYIDHVDQMLVKQGIVSGGLFGQYPCKAAILYAEGSNYPQSYCDLCPYPASVCGPTSLMAEYDKLINWDIPKLWHKEMQKGRLIKRDKFRTLLLIRRFTQICYSIAFAELNPQAKDMYEIKDLV